MKRIPVRIFIIVLIMGLIGVVGMVVLKYNIDTLSATYHEIMDVHAVNQEYTKSIMASLYRHQAQVMNHILADSSDMYEKYEENEAALRELTGNELTEFGLKMQGNEHERFYHKVYSDYYSYLSNVDIVLELSKNGDKNMATYCVNTSMAKFLDNVDRDLSELDNLTVTEMADAKRYMDRLIAISQISEMICIVGILAAVIICLSYCFKLTTKLANAKEEADRQKQKADAANKSKSLFLAKMSHEIRTPIHAIIGMNEMILREEDREDILEYGMDVKRSAYSLLSTINDILDLSKIESGKMKLVLVEYDFSTLLYDIVNMISMKTKDKALEIKLSLDENLPSKLYGDDVRLRQILLNLLGNAVKYTEQGSVTLSVSGRSEGERAELLFEVKDTGIGIKQEDLQKLFLEFERIEEKRNRNIEGTGLGMSITTQLLAMMGSRLQVESVYGEGSRFFFSLSQGIVSREPVGNLEERIKAQTVEYRYETDFIAPDVRILLVDDNQVNRKVFVGLIKELRMTVDEAAGGLQCLEMVGRQTYDIIFLDHMMPDLDGVETLKRMRGQKLAEGTPVIVLTANALSGEREKYLKIGFTDYLSKPFRPEKLEEMLLAYLPAEKIKRVEAAERTVGSKKRKRAVEDFGEQGFPAVDGMDWKYAALFQKDAKILLDTIEAFLQMLEPDAAELERLLEQVEALDGREGDAASDEAWRQYCVKVHAMKSAAALIGAVSLSGVARMLEDAARQYNRKTVRVVTPIFLQEWRGYRERLSRLLPEEVGEELLPFDADGVEELLKDLRGAMEEYDVDVADAIMEKLKQFRMMPPLEKCREKLSLAVMNLDAEAVSAVADEMMRMFNGTGCGTGIDK